MSLSLAESGVASAHGALNGYWGQHGNERLRDYCDTGITYVTLAFVNEAPEQNLSNYPGTNFAAHCWEGTYSNEKNITSDLLSNCRYMKEDIGYCQGNGVKVLLSIGGVYDPIGSNYEVTTEDNGEYFAEFLYGAFGPYDENWDGPRPFDASEAEHISIDGFDFDIEWGFDNKPYITMIETFRNLDSSLMITGAPQCPTSDAWFDMKEMIQKAAFDALFVQFYNNPSCDAIMANSLFLIEEFNFDQWVDVLDDSEKSKDAKIFIGLPASSDAAGSGYISPEALKELVCEYKDKEHFGGISLWDLTRGASNVIEGKTYNEYALGILQDGCDAVSMTTRTTSASSTSTSLGARTSTSHPLSSPSASADPTATTETASSSASSSAFARSSSPTRLWSNSTMTSDARTSDGPTASTSTSLKKMTTRTEYTTTTRTVMDCPPYVDCPKDGYVTTEVIPIYTTVCPVTETDEPVPDSTDGPVSNDVTETTSKPAQPTEVPCDGDCQERSKPNQPTAGVQPSIPCDGDCQRPSRPEEPTGGDIHQPFPCEGDCSGTTKTKVIETIVTTITIEGSSSIKTVTQSANYGPKPPTTTPVPTGGWTSMTYKPSAIAAVPVDAGAAGSTAGMTILAGMLAIQMLVL